MLKVLQRYAPEFLVYPDKLFDKDDHSLVIQEWDGILVHPRKKLVYLLKIESVLSAQKIDEILAGFKNIKDTVSRSTVSDVLEGHQFECFIGGQLFNEEDKTRAINSGINSLELSGQRSEIHLCDRPLTV